MSTTDLPGSRLLVGRYRLVERLGAGGMSVVWRGFDEVLGRQVAVKVLPPSTSADPSFRRRLRAEAQAAARLSHPHITNVYDYGEATTADGEAAPYVVMELVDGESLAAVLARVQRLPWPATVRICAEVSAALAAAHSRGIVHRDVTPANVMLTSAGAKVVDFGISALIGENDIDPDGSLLGTPAYLAPERLEGGQVSPATDVYAVGLMIYRTMIGQLPWDVGTTTALLRAHQYVEPEPLPHVDGLPPAVAALIGRCLEKRPEDRPSSAELAHVLAGVSAGAPAAGRSYVTEGAGDSGEDTTILPPQDAFTNGLGRARVAAAGSAHPGRGVAAVPAGQPSADVPVSPAPAGAVPVHEAEAAVAGRHAAVVPAPAAAAVSPASAAAGVLDEPVADPRPAAFPEPSGDSSPESPGQPPAHVPGRLGGARNSRFGALPRRATVPSDAVPMHADGAADATEIRPVSGPGRPSDGLRPANVDGNGALASKSPGKRRRTDPRNRRVLIGAGLVVLLGAAVYAWSLTVEPPKRANNAALPTVVAPDGNCVVSYAVWSDDGSRFQAQLTIANRDTQPIADWKLWFIMNGDQVVSGKLSQGTDVPVSASQTRLDQQGKEVTLSSAAALNPQAAASVNLEGRYDQSNAAPMAFKLNGRTCETFVSGKPGAPSLPVEHLSNGGVRLGPKPTTSTPAPGVTIDAQGIAHIRPTGTTSGSPAIPSMPPTTTPTPTASSSPPPEITPSPPPTPTTTSAAPPTTDPTSDPAPPPTLNLSPDPLDSGVLLPPPL